jgi:membrane protein implicated in regulation of membrane protease activity
MLGREPRLSHTAMRWLIISMMVINGVQLALLQGTINATMSLDFAEVWTYVALSFVGLLLSAVLLAYAFMRSRGKASEIRVKDAGSGGRGTVSSDDVRGSDT